MLDAVPHLHSHTHLFTMDGQATAEQQQAIIQQLQEQVQAKALQELMTQMTDQCFNRCAKTSGGERLTSSEQGCLAMCMDRYMDTMSLVNKAMVAKSQR